MQMKNSNDLDKGGNSGKYDIILCNLEEPPILVKLIIRSIFRPPFWAYIVIPIDVGPRK